MLNEFEKRTVLSWMRKLARISNELSQLAVEIADYDGVSLKSQEEPEKMLPPAMDVDSNLTLCLADKYVPKEAKLAKSDKELKLNEFDSKISTLEKLVKDASTSDMERHYKAALARVKGHRTRLLQDTVKSSPGQEAKWKSKIR